MYIEDGWNAVVHTVRSKHTLTQPIQMNTTPTVLRPTESAIMSIIENIVYARKRIEAQHNEIVTGRGWNKAYI